MLEIIIKAIVGAVIAATVGATLNHYCNSCCNKESRNIGYFKIRMYRSRISENKSGRSDIRESGIDIEIGKNGGDNNE